jgi:hypothetical protein
VACKFPGFFHEAPMLYRYLETIIDINGHKQGSLSSFRFSQDGVCTDSFENLSANILKGDQSNDTKFNPPLFSLVNTFKGEGWLKIQNGRHK